MRIIWPQSEEAWCVYFRSLDERFNTHPRSPLHHDARCTIHKPTVRLP